MVTSASLFNRILVLHEQRFSAFITQIFRHELQEPIPAQRQENGLWEVPPSRGAVGELLAVNGKLLLSVDLMMGTENEQFAAVASSKP